MRWVTYFPKFNRFHLTKDVGLIPYYVASAGYRASLVGHAEEYFDMPREVQGLEVERLRDEGRRFFLDRAFLKWLRQNAKSVDVLHLFHLVRDSIFYGAYFKRLNPEGKLYLKMDVYNDHLYERKRYSNGELKNLILRKVEKRFLAGLDMVTVENREALELAKQTYPELKNVLHYLPNGSNDAYLMKNFPSIPRKEKLILSVGRPGSPDKNYELLLRALPEIDWGEWRMEIIGMENDGFRAKREECFSAHPHLREKVAFLGPIHDRQKLYEKYACTSIFFLPSRSESFGIAFAEALYFGACLVGHRKMYAYSEICDEGRFGTFFVDDDRNSFIDALEQAKFLSARSGFVEEASRFARDHFGWSGLIEDLIAKLGYG
jgi:glycosyltransferase involved in cell wall biosynthesis